MSKYIIIIIMLYTLFIYVCMYVLLNYLFIYLIIYLIYLLPKKTSRTELLFKFVTHSCKYALC